VDRDLALKLFELYYEHHMAGDEDGDEQAGYIKESLRGGGYHVDVDEVEGIYRLRHVVRAEGIDALVAERPAFGEIVIK